MRVAWSLLLLALAMGTLAAGFVLHVRSRTLPAVDDELGHARTAGVYHVHSELSHDSEVGVDAIVTAAHAAEASVVVLTEHNTQEAGPRRRDGVLLLSFAELSTPHGHVVGLGARDTANHEARQSPALMEYVGKQGGWPVVAHPTDPKRPWTGPWQGVHGLEIASVSSAARTVGGPLMLGLVPLAMVFPIHPHLAMAQLYQRDPASVGRWTDQGGPTLGLCAADAHGLMDLELNFRVWQVVVHTQLPEEPPAAQDAWLRAVRQRQFHCASALFGHAIDLRFAARLGGRTVHESGGMIPSHAIDEIVAVASHGVDPQWWTENARMVLFRAGEPVLDTAGVMLRYPSPVPGRYHVELRVHIPRPMFGAHLATVAYSNTLDVVSSDPTPPGVAPL